MDREKERAASRGMLSEHVHHLARLAQIETVERLVEQEQRLRREEPDRGEDAPMLSLGQAAKLFAEQRLEREESR